MLCCFGKSKKTLKRTMSPYKVRRRSEINHIIERDSGEQPRIKKIVINPNQKIVDNRNGNGNLNFEQTENPGFQSEFNLNRDKTNKHIKNKKKSRRKLNKNKKKRSKKPKEDTKKEVMALDLEQNGILDLQNFKSQEINEASLNDIYIQMQPLKSPSKRKLLQDSPSSKSPNPKHKHLKQRLSQQTYSDCDISLSDGKGPSELMNDDLNGSDLNFIESQSNVTGNEILITPPFLKAEKPAIVDQSIDEIEEECDEKSKLVLSVKSIQLSETQEFNENINKNELKNKLDLKINSRATMTSNKYWRSEKESAASEVSFNSEISSVMVSSYRKSAFYEPFFATMRPIEIDDNDVSVENKMRVLTPTRSVDNFEIISKFDSKSRCNSLVEVNPSDTVNKRIGFMINMNMNTTNDATSQIEEKSVRLSAHMPGNMMQPKNR
ncbi:unnamed protein product [Moneuplotes crassus]|uniref:Uncharacterized protein n=1 Tax=Euplotes crassus TaxID=5936 RepID=A0AAD1U0F4_EUPCR|nr:unnamed protein product [Moneuplotes crassus]